MGARTTQAWAGPEDDTWGARLELRLALTHSASRPLIEAVVAESQQACAESGRPALELFGDADAYADEVAAERISVEERAAADMDGLAPADHRQGVLLTSAFAGALLSIGVLLARGWSVEVTPWQVVLIVAGHLAFAAGLAAELSRRAGLLRRSRTLWVVALASLGGGAALAMALAGQPPLGSVPTLVPFAVYLTVLVVAWRLPLATPDLAAPPVPMDEWFDQLDGLLRGRYYLPRATAAAHLAEARTVWHESGAAHPQDELGSPQVYALQLVDGSPHHHRGRRRVQAWAATAIAALWIATTALFVATDDEPGRLLWRVGVSLVFVGFAAAAWRLHLRDRREVAGTTVVGRR